MQLKARMSDYLQAYAFSQWLVTYSDMALFADLQSAHYLLCQSVKGWTEVIPPRSILHKNDRVRFTYSECLQQYGISVALKDRVNNPDHTLYLSQEEIQRILSSLIAADVDFYDNARMPLRITVGLTAHIGPYNDCEWHSTTYHNLNELK